MSLSLSAATFTVTSANDAGAGTLRAAITSANGTVGADTIQFNIAGAGLHTIGVLTELPAITDPVTIDGWTQPVFTGTPLIELTGSAAGAGVDGLQLDNGSDGTTIRGLIINGFSSDGIFANNSDNHVFHGNWIGLDADGTTAVANGTGIGFLTSHDNTIGGTGADQRNVIGGNSSSGGQINSNGMNGTTIIGNYIGTDVTGLLDRGNGRGIAIFNSIGVIVGGFDAEEANVIAGGNTGIDISGSSVTTQIYGNLLGVGSDGTTPLGISTQAILARADSGAVTYITNNVIANSVNIPGNGITLANDTTDVIISLNSIRNNFGLGVDLGSDGVTQNDADDPDLGENGLLNYAVITSATEAAGTVTIVGTLNSTPSRAFGIDFFSNTVCDPTGFGEGETYIGAVGLATNASGDASFNVTLPGPATGFITALTHDAFNNTSEFSLCSAIVSGAVTGTAQLTSTSYSGTEPSGFVTIGVSRTGGTEPASVQYTITDGTAVNGVDYTEPPTGAVSWAAGDTATKFISINVTNDALVEGTETFNITLSAPSNIALGTPSSATAFIIDDEVPPGGTVGFSASTATVSETAGTVTLTVNRTGGSTGAASVDFATANGSATAGSDYVGQTGTLNWVAGDATPKQIIITISDDLAIEGPETFTVTLSNAVGASLGFPVTNTVTITDDDSPGTVAFSSATASVGEAAGTVTLTVNRTGGSSGAASVDYSTANGSATGGADYTAVVLGTLNWADGDSSPKQIVISINNDALVEGPETFTVTLSNAIGATLGAPATNTVTITDDDAAGTLAFSTAAYNTSEGAGSVTITVNRTGGSSGAATVDYSTAPGTAGATDYTAVSGTLNWADGDSAPKTFNVPITNDGIAEPAESFIVNLSNATGAALGSPTTATVTIDASASGVAVPTASTTMLLLMSMVLAVAAIVALRK